MLYFTVPCGQTVQGFSVEVYEKTSDLPVINKIDSINSAEYLNGIKHENSVYYRSTGYFHGNNGERDYFQLDISNEADNYSEIIIAFDYFSESYSNDKS